MDWQFWLAQSLGAVALVLCVVGLQFKKKEHVVLFYMFANALIATEYFLLGAIAGGAIDSVCVVRNLLFYIFAKKGKRSPVWILLLIEGALIAAGIFGWQNWWSIIPIFVGIVYTYGNWQDNVLILKITAAISGAGWMTYSLVVQAYISAGQEALILISAITAISIMLSKKNETKSFIESENKSIENQR